MIQWGLIGFYDDDDDDDDVLIYTYVILWLLLLLLYTLWFYILLELIGIKFNKHNQETGDSHRHDPPEKCFTATEPGQTMPY